MSRVIVKTVGLSREDWLEYRRKGLGGSDASTVCGLNPYSSKLTLWADKTGRLPEKEDSEAMRTGRDLEQYVASRFEEATGKRVHRRNAMFAHDKYDFITANVDREVVGENAGLECKTTSAYARSDFENGEIPLNYLCQCRHYMNVMGYEKMYLAVLVMGRAFYWFEIPYDKAEGDALLKMEIDFWNKYIVPDERPEADGSDSAASTIRTLWHTEVEESACLLGDDTNFDRYLSLQEQKKAIEKAMNEVKQNAILHLDGAETGYTNKYNISYKESSRTSIDTKALKEKYPQAYADCSKTTKTRTFRVSGRKDV